MKQITLFLTEKRALESIELMELLNQKGESSFKVISLTLKDKSGGSDHGFAIKIQKNSTYYYL